MKYKDDIAHLLTARIKCIEPFLGMEHQGWSVGQIMDIVPVDDYLFYMSIPEKYPLNFSFLEWYEERRVEDMPAYVKLNPKNTNENGEILKVIEWEIFEDGITCDYSTYAGRPVVGFMSAKYLLPATKNEYEEFNYKCHLKIKL